MLNTACAPGGKFVREPRSHHYRPSFNVYKCADARWIQLLGLEVDRFMPPLLRALSLDEARLRGLNNVRHAVRNRRCDRRTRPPHVAAVAATR